MDKLEFVVKVTGVTLDADDAAAIYEACGYKDEALSGRSTIRNLKKRLSDANLRADKLSAALKKAFDEKVPSVCTRPCTCMECPDARREKVYRDEGSYTNIFCGIGRTKCTDPGKYEA